MKTLTIGLAACAALRLTACADAPACDPDDIDCADDSGDDGKADGLSAAAGAQMNDLTIVAPLPTSQAELDGMLAATSNGIGGDLLPADPYMTLFPDPVDNNNVGSDIVMTYANLRVVAVRFDPCFAQIGPITNINTCDNQIRLVFQSLTYDATKGTTAIDGAVHAFYRLNHTDLIAAVKKIIALRKAQGVTKTMGALAAHPLLVKQGNTGAFAKGVQQILLSYCGAQNLIRFTHFQSTNLQTVWNFQGYDLDANLNATAMVIPTLPSHGTTATFFAGFGLPITGGLTPETTSTDDIAALLNATTAKTATKTKVQAAFDASLRIENPNFHSPNTIDCASCHAADAGRILVGQGVLDLKDSGANTFVANSNWVSKTSMKQTTDPTKQTINIHMVSYKNSNLMISQRVINETANLVAYFNGVVFH